MRARSLVMALAACLMSATVPAYADEAATDIQSSQPILSGEVPAVPGPKRTVAVAAFDASIGPQANGTNWNVGGGVAAMLATALEESDRFIVVDRSTLPAVLTEQQMAAHGVSTGTAAPMPGSVTPAQYLIAGSVTEFSTADSGGGMAIGGASGMFGGGLSLTGSKGRVGFDIRVVDTRTTAIVSAFKIRRELETHGVGFTGGYGGVSLGGNKFWNTPLGDATRSALNEAVDRIAETVAGGQWEGQVVEADGRTIYVNAGANAGLKSGDRLAVQRTTKTMTDPATGEVLSQEKATLGTIVLTAIQPKIASGVYTPSEPGKPARGDLVTFAN